MSRTPEIEMLYACSCRSECSDGECGESACLSDTLDTPRPDTIIGTTMSDTPEPEPMNPYAHIPPDLREIVDRALCSAFRAGQDNREDAPAAHTAATREAEMWEALGEALRTAKGAP